MSKLRPTLRTVSSYPCPSNGTAYLMILAAVEQRPGLIHGELKAHGEFCAIGSFFHVNPRAALSADLIDEVAMVNDSVPYLGEKKRKDYVRRWLRWKLQQLGMPLPGRKSEEPTP